MAGGCSSDTQFKRWQSLHIVISNHVSHVLNTCGTQTTYESHSSNGTRDRFPYQGKGESVRRARGSITKASMSEVAAQTERVSLVVIERREVGRERKIR